MSRWSGGPGGLESEQHVTRPQIPAIWFVLAFDSLLGDLGRYVFRISAGVRRCTAPSVASPKAGGEFLFAVWPTTVSHPPIACGVPPPARNRSHSKKFSSGKIPRDRLRQVTMLASGEEDLSVCLYRVDSV